MPKSLFEHLDSVEDERFKRGVRYPTGVILKLVTVGYALRLVAVEHMSNFFSEIWEDIATLVGSDRKSCPDPTTFRRVLERIDRESLEKEFREWVSNLLEDEKFLVASVDAKTLKGSNLVKVLNVFAHKVKFSLAQVDIKEGEGESTALKKALGELFEDFPGLRILTGDSAYSGRSLCKAIKDVGKDYIVQLKKNQKGVYEDAKKILEENVSKRPANASSEKKRKTRNLDCEGLDCQTLSGEAQFSLS